jgi:chromosome segregation ATPase
MFKEFRLEKESIIMGAVMRSKENKSRLEF